MTHRRLASLVAVVLLGCAAGGAGAAHQPPAPSSQPPAQSEPPTLVVLMVVDQMRGDFLDRYSRQFTGGLRRLARDGALFTRAYQDHGLTETAPGHSTILTGRNPRSTGIVRNNDGVQDSGDSLLGTTGQGASPERLSGTTLFDWLRARDPRTRVLSVSRKDRSAILLVGRSKEPVFWYSGGRFTTSSYYGDTLPTFVREFNGEMAAWRPPVWDLLLPPDQYSEPDSIPWEYGGRAVTFPKQVAWPPGSDGVAMADTPWMDSLTLALVLRGVNAMGLGRGPGTDLLTIGLSSGDGVGHGWGPDSREIHDYYLRLDRWLGTFFDSMAVLRDRNRIVLAITSDHGISSYPQWARLHGYPNARHVVMDTILGRWNARIAEQLGQGRWIRYRSGGLVSMDREAMTTLGMNPDSVADLMMAEIRRVPGVRRVDDRRSIANADTARDAVARRWQHALPDTLPVAVLITLDDGNVFGPYNGQARHGQNSGLDAHVVLSFWGTPFRRGRFDRRVSTVDIAPTLAHVLGVEPLEPVTGSVLREALK